MSGFVNSMGAYRCKSGFVESMKLVDSMSGFVGSMKGFVNSMGVLRCVIPVVCVTNEREESVVKQHNLFRKMFYSNN
jgi:hypothetical protein